MSQTCFAKLSFPIWAFFTLFAVALSGENVASGADALSLADSVRSALSSGNGSLLQGSAQLFGVDQCNDSSDSVFQVFKSCFGANPAAPYVLPLVPTRPGEFVDELYKEVLTETISGQRMSAVYRLGNDDAAIVVIKLPSRAAYFAFQSYLFTRYMPGTRKPSANPDRTDIFGSVGNSVNHRVIEQNLSSAWEQEVVVISSTNPTLAANLRARLEAAAIPPAQIFVEPIGTLVRRGLSATSDEMTSLIRFALPEDAASANAWRAAVAEHVKVMRWIEAGASNDRFPDPALDFRTANSEQSLAQAQAELMNLLRDGLAVPRFVQSRNFLTPDFLVGPYCISHGLNCMGDSQDNDSYRFYAAGKMPLRQTLLVVGIDPITTGNAAYTSIAVQSGDLQAGILSKSQTGGQAGFSSGELRGSAQKMLVDSGRWDKASADLKAKIDLFYAVVFARSCSGLKTQCAEIPASAIPLSSPVSLLRRAYLKEGSLRGAEPANLLSPIGVDWKR